MVRQPVIHLRKLLHRCGHAWWLPCSSTSTRVITGTFEASATPCRPGSTGDRWSCFQGAPLTARRWRRSWISLATARARVFASPATTAWPANRVELHSRGFAFPDGREDGRRVVPPLPTAQLATLESAGANLDLLRLEPLLIGGIYPAHGEDRLLLRLDDVPETLVGALLAIEDRGFYSHLGFFPERYCPRGPGKPALGPWSPAAVRSRSSWSRTTT
jgi:hypothetical protein